MWICDFTCDGTYQQNICIQCCPVSDAKENTRSVFPQIAEENLETSVYVWSCMPPKNTVPERAVGSRIQPKPLIWPCYNCQTLPHYATLCPSTATVILP